MKKPSELQVGGEHYKSMPIQPSEFCQRNGLNWCESNVIKYVCRYKNKNGKEDIKKAIHYYQTEEKGEAPSAVVVTGGTSGMRDIIPLFSNLLGLEVLIGNPFAKVNVDPATAKSLAPYAPLYAVAVGLALRND